MAPLSIDRVILHQVHRRPLAGAPAGQAPLLKRASVVSTLTPEIEQFLGAHIEGSLNDYRARRAHFVTAGAGSPVLGMCDAVFADPKSESVFIAQSRDIAQALIDAASGRQGPDARIHDGDLVVCAVSWKRSGVSVPMLALLKIDPRDGLTAEYQTLPDGTVQAVLQPVSGVLTDARLQKSAFVWSPTERATQKHDLVVLDLQTDSRSATRWAASYFINKFLVCETGLNRREQTMVFVYQTIAWINQFSTLDDPAKLHACDRARDAIYNQQVDVESFAAELLPDEAQRTAYIEHLQNQKLTELTFEPDPALRAQLAEFVTFDGDDDLTVRVRRASYGPGLEVDPGAGPGADGTYTITIRTSTWRARGGGP